MNTIANRFSTLLLVVAVAGCAAEVIDEGVAKRSYGGDVPDAGESDGGDADACHPTRQEGQTCSTDCDCVDGLACSACVSTTAHNCVEYCVANDPFCHYGTATCPIGEGIACDSVKLCQ